MLDFVVFDGLAFVNVCVGAGDVVVVIVVGFSFVDVVFGVVVVVCGALASASNFASDLSEKWNECFKRKKEPANQISRI